MHIIDLTLEIRDGSLSYPGTATGLVVERLNIGIPGSTLSRFTHFDVHCGTHFDAPLHFVPRAADVATTPLVFPDLVVVSSSENPIPPAVLQDHPALEGKAVLFSTGWERHAGTRAFFVGFPVLSQALAELLVARKVALVGLDSPSVDAAGSDFSVHRTLLGAGIPIVEGLINLAGLVSPIRSGRRARLAAFPLRIRGLEGSPVRAVALVESS